MEWLIVLLYLWMVARLGVWGWFITSENPAECFVEKDYISGYRGYPGLKWLVLMLLALPHPKFNKEWFD